MPQVRVGIHWGEVGFLRDVGFFGIELHRADRIAGAARGGQILISEAANQQSASLPAGVTAVDHGTFWLKDLRDPERLIELIVDQPSRSPNARPASGRDLPTFPADLVGRDEVLAELLAALGNSPGSITTLCGPGGVGKTRLGVEVLRRAASRPSHFVDLSSAESSAQLVPAVARALGLDASTQDLQDAVATELQQQRALVVVDNLEQIIDSAPTLAAMARSAPAATIIATSRLPLRVTNERVVDIDPLATGDADDLPSSKLFLQLAELTNPNDRELKAASAICGLLDGLPLAIELAAGRVAQLGLDEVERQLRRSTDLLSGGRRDAPERHRTLTATVLWSYELLSAEARAVFRQLSQYPAGATIDTLTQRETPDARDSDTAATVGAAELVEHRLASLTIASEGARFSMLRVIREVAAGELEREGELATARIHAASYLRKRSGDAARLLGSSVERQAYEGLLQELENYHYLFSWVDQDHDTGDAALLDASLASAANLLMFWWHDHIAEGVEALRRLTELPAARTSRYYPRSLVSMSILATYGGSPGESMRLAERAVEAARARPGSGNTLCSALQQLAISCASHDEGPRAFAAAEEVLSIAQQLPDLARAIQLVGIGPAFLSENYVADAEAVFAEAIDIFDAQGPSWLAAAPVARLGECALRRNSLDEADELAQRGIERWKESPGVNGRSRAWSGLARVRWRQGRVDEAKAIAKDAAAAATELKAIGDLPWALIVGAAVASSEERYEQAQQLFAFATAMGRSYSQPILGAVRYDLSAAQVAVTEALGAEQTAAQWSAGQALSLSKIMQLVAGL